MHGHLPFLVSRVSMVVRHVSYFYHSATRLIELGLYSLQVPRRKGARKRWKFAPPSATRRVRRSSRPPKPLLIHYHIFKNAGSLVERTLQQNFGARLHLYDAPAPNGMVSSEELVNYVMHNPEVKAISSHHALLPPPLIPERKVITSILIRDPIARIRSTYAFERRQPHFSAGGNKAKELEFKEYVEWRLTSSRGMFCNYQVYFCSRTSETGHDDSVTVAHLQRALANLHRIDVVGTVERYEEWLALAQTILQPAFRKLRLVVERENASNPAAEVGQAAVLSDLVSEMGSELADRLLQCNHLDLCLHQAANVLLDERLAEKRARRLSGRPAITP